MSSVCQSCGGELRDPDGSYYTQLEDYGRTARVIAVCRKCASGKEESAPKNGRKQRATARDRGSQ